MRLLLLLFVTLASPLGLTGCSSDEAPASSAPACEGAACDGEADTGVADTNTGADAAADTTTSVDTDPGGDDAQEDVNSGLGRFGDPCDENEECAAGLCIDTTELGRICTDFCRTTEQCPDGFRCTIYINEEAVSVCLEETNTLCDPCDRDLDCGGSSDRCVPLFDGLHCATDCSRGQECPDGYQCTPQRDADGEIIAEQCTPDNNLCTDCFDEDRDGYGLGEGCAGFDCNDDDIAVNPGADELCDSIDNDCDDLTDEGFDTDTDINNCGACGRRCEPPENAVSVCIDGDCQIADCEEGWFDVDGDLSNGCEYACTPDPGAGIDVPDIDNIDSDCDGVDGDVTQAVFVQKDIGADGGPGTLEEPLRTITAGIALALTEGKDVYVGTSATPYNETVRLVGGVNVYGGYDFDRGLSRDTTAITRIDGGLKAVIAEDFDTPTIFSGFEIRSADAVSPGASSYGIWLRNVSGLELRRNRIISGRGAPGAPGTMGTPGAQGEEGTQGQQGCEEFCLCDLCFDECRPRGGAGATGETCPDGLLPGSGGTGGQGGFGSGSGDAGIAGSGDEGGRGGTGGRAEMVGQVGVIGGPGIRGTDGNGGDGGVISEEGLWISNGGRPGGAGRPGSGGGGGGGGGGSRQCFEGDAQYDGGGGGGGGGAGGCGGNGAAGGTGGGGSFGIVILSSSVQIAGNTIDVGLGGPGGEGGLGGDGGTGGDGGLGGQPSDDSGSGGVGGEGGIGGRGGHGGGGAGGPSIGIYRTRGGNINLGTNTITVPEQGGPGGQSPGSDGSPGISAPIF